MKKIRGLELSLGRELKTTVCIKLASIASLIIEIIKIKNAMIINHLLKKTKNSYNFRGYKIPKITKIIGILKTGQNSKINNVELLNTNKLLTLLL